VVTNGIAKAGKPPRGGTRSRRLLALDRVNLDRARPPQAQRVDPDGAADAVATQDAEIVD
jgi:hypothetical protein